MPSFFRFAAVLTMTALFALGARAEVVLSIDNVAGNPGDTVEVVVNLNSTSGDAPTVLQLFIAYDRTRLAPAANYFQEGSSPVLPGPVVTAAGKQIDSEIYDEGAIGFVVFGVGSQAIPNGLLMTVAFQVLDFTTGGASVLLDGIEQAEAIELGTPPQDSFSTASNATANPLTVRFNDGAVITNCAPRAGIPANVTATQDRPDGVAVAWSAVSNANAEYRVYRNIANNFVGADPLGPGWQLATSFVDTTALPPATVGGGCACAQNTNPVNYYYWVVARTAAGCAGDPGGPVQGARSAAKFSPVLEVGAPKAFPCTLAAGGANLAAPGEALAVRVEGANPESLQAELGGVETGTYALDAIDAGAGGIWLRATPVAAWPAGATIAFSVSSAGGPLLVRTFVIDAAPKQAADDAPEAVDPATLPYLDAGYNAPQRLPERVYDVPRRFTLPIPAGEDPARTVLYYYDDADGQAAWRPASQVSGWLSATPRIITVDGVASVEFDARHGGIVQLGYIPTEARQAASAIPLGDAFLIMSALALLAWHCRPRRAAA